jgi:hypothetical protein
VDEIFFELILGNPVGIFAVVKFNEFTRVPGIGFLGAFTFSEEPEKEMSFKLSILPR